MSTKGQQFAKALTSLHKVGPRTRRYRDNVDQFSMMIADVEESVIAPFAFSEQRGAALREGWTAVGAYRKHIEGGRVSGRVISAVQALTPYQFAQFLGRMIDDNVTNMQQAEVWLRKVEI